MSQESDIVESNMLSGGAPKFDLIYAKVDKLPHVLVFPACEFIAGDYDTKAEPDIVFITSSGKKYPHTKEEFKEFLSKGLEEWGDLEVFIIHPKGLKATPEIQFFWKTYNNH